ncbi:MAG: 50S ribosomal protein L7/L12 [Chloroflexota bacterium]|nr:50S ribosomal protein L7/L12 [Chloroflexota bacterium]
MTQEEIIKAVREMTVLELSELVEALKEELGVSATAPVAVAAGPGAQAAPAAEAVEEEQTEFDVILQEIGPKKIQVIKAVRELTGLGLRESKSVVDEAPGPVLETVPQGEAESAKATLEEAGATVEIQ